MGSQKRYCIIQSFCSIIHKGKFCTLIRIFSLISIILKILYSIEYKYGRRRNTPTKMQSSNTSSSSGAFGNNKILNNLGFHHQDLKHLLNNKKAPTLHQILFNLGLEVNPTNKIHSNRPIPKKAYRGEKMFII